MMSDHSPSQDPAHTASDGHGSLPMPAIETAWSEREFEDFMAFKLGFIAGFQASGEGWNGEYPARAEVVEWLNKRAMDFATNRLIRQRLDDVISAAETRRFQREMAALADGASSASTSEAGE